MFSTLRQGNPFYILDKGKNVNLRIGQIEYVSALKPKYNSYNTALYNINNEKVVDLRVKLNNESLDFKNVPSDSVIADFGNGLVISESRDAIMSEIDAMLQSSKNIINNIDYHKGVVSKCEEMLKSLSPDFAKEKDRDDAINKLTEQVSELKNNYASISSDISKLIKVLSNKVEQ